MYKCLKNKFLSIKDLKSRKAFEKKDLILYCLLFVFILSLFLSFIILPRTSSSGFSIFINDKTVLTHEYGKDFNVNQTYKNRITIENTDEGYYIKITFAEGYNLIYVNEKDKYVKMQESDCPSKNCTYMQPIKDAGAIYCAPRDLKILPLNDKFIPPTTGGNG